MYHFVRRKKDSHSVNYMRLGATAVEDKLQYGVKSTLRKSCFKQGWGSGCFGRIHIWFLKKLESRFCFISDSDLQRWTCSTGYGVSHGPDSGNLQLLPATFGF